MDGKSHAPLSAPTFVPSAEITPAEYEYYMRKAHQMRAESMADLFRAVFAPLRHLFARAKAPAAERHEPVLAKSRTA